MLFQQLVNRMCSPLLVPSLLTSCQRLVDNQWRKFTFSGGGRSLLNFRQNFQISDNPPPLFALEKAVFSPLIGQNFRKFVIFHEGGGAAAPPRFPPLSTTCYKVELNVIVTSCSNNLLSYVLQFNNLSTSCE